MIGIIVHAIVYQVLSTFRDSDIASIDEPSLLAKLNMPVNNAGSDYRADSTDKVAVGEGGHNLSWVLLSDL